MLAAVMHVLWRLRQNCRTLSTHGKEEQLSPVDPYNIPTGIRAPVDQSIRKPDKTEWTAKYMTFVSRNKVLAILGIAFVVLTGICVILQQAVPQVYG